MKSSLMHPAMGVCPHQPAKSVQVNLIETFLLLYNFLLVHEPFYLTIHPVLFRILFVTKSINIMQRLAHSSVGSVADLRTGGRWFDLQLGQYSFRGLMIVIATGFIPLSPLSVVSTKKKYAKAASGLERILCRVLVKRTPGKHRSRCTSRQDIPEILLKTGLNTIQSIIQCNDLLCI